MKRRVLCVASMTAALAAGAVTAQPAYPVKPVRLVVARRVAVHRKYLWANTVGNAAGAAPPRPRGESR